MSCAANAYCLRNWYGLNFYCRYSFLFINTTWELYAVICKENTEGHLCLDLFMCIFLPPTYSTVVSDRCCKQYSSFRLVLSIVQWLQINRFKICKVENSFIHRIWRPQNAYHDKPVINWSNLLGWTKKLYSVILKYIFKILRKKKNAVEEKDYLKCCSDAH